MHSAQFLLKKVFDAGRYPSKLEPLGGDSHHLLSASVAGTGHGCHPRGVVVAGTCPDGDHEVESVHETGLEYGSLVWSFVAVECHGSPPGAICLNPLYGKTKMQLHDRFSALLML